MDRLDALGIDANRKLGMMIDHAPEKMSLVGKLSTDTLPVSMDVDNNSMMMTRMKMNILRNPSRGMLIRGGVIMEARNMALKAELMLQEKGRSYYSRRSYGGDNYKTYSDMNKAINISPTRHERLMEEKTTGKQKATKSNDYPLIKAIHVVERDEEDGEVCCEPNGDEGEFKEDGECQNYVVRRMMLTPKLKDDTRRHQLFRTRCTIGNNLFNVIIDNGEL
ncbi:unnamed protein product [Dovyalis caffra]|uniref:Uncharacterized protein n=1 Tax=Dovyalis caffra TaxID=77055 RepID=A0AAV1RNS5_9ROSI|nr:unnamed protein product [Dovyalis caffra]